MRLPYYQVDVFTNKIFAGNPAGVCLLPSGWLSDELLQNIAFENNLSETAFLVSKPGGWELRWFTPTAEVDLCGHATIAPAHVLFREEGIASGHLDFQTKSGVVSVEQSGERLILDFPSRPAQACEVPDDLYAAIGAMPSKVQRARDYLLVFDHEAQIRNLKPDFQVIRNWDCLGVIVTAPGEKCDFVSRFFAPAVGINEDPVTGSAHSTLIPYWSECLNKTDMRALQISARGGELFCRNQGERVKIGGNSVTYLKGEIFI